jgi:pimeloyl-ACP methyl ester carboxylesterase
MSEHRLARPDGAEIVWYDDGVADAGGGETVLLVMGLGYPAAMWYRTAPALVDRYRVISVDNRGAGRTGDVVGAPYSVEMMAADLNAVLDAAGVDAAHVVALSLGGLLGQELALSYSERVRSLTLVATHPGAAVAVWDADALVVLASRGEAGVRAAAEMSIPFNYAPATAREQIEQDWAVRFPLACTAAGYAAQLSGTAPWVKLDQLPTLDVPTLILHGDLDRLVPTENGRILADAIPGAELQIVVGANHLLITDREDEVNRLLRNWLDRQAAATPA